MKKIISTITLLMIVIQIISISLVRRSATSIDVFYPGIQGSKYFRIPSIITTEKGTLLAAIDARIDNATDSPNNIDTVIKRSENNGQTWDFGLKIFDFPGDASTIDTILLEDEKTNRIFIIADLFPESYGAFNVRSGTGYKVVNNKKYMIVYDKNGYEFTIRENGKIFNGKGNYVSYEVDSYFNLYHNGVKIGNVFTNSSPFKVYSTSYLLMSYSDDNGMTWSKPIELNKFFKKEWMTFLGTGPGRGIQLKRGSNSGRLVIPVYYMNQNKMQSSAVIFSDDHGKTWRLGESPNDGRLEKGEILSSRRINKQEHELTESQVVEMPDGQLKLFMRNRGKYVKVATSFDGGRTWDPIIEEEDNLLEPYSQMSVINYSRKIDGKDAVIFSNPNSVSRKNGTLRIGLITNEGIYSNGKVKYGIDWRYSSTVKRDFFAYSCLTELKNGDIGILYEGTPNNLNITFKRMMFNR